MANCETVVDFYGADYMEYIQLWDIDRAERFNSNYMNDFNPGCRNRCYDSSKIVNIHY